MKEICLNNKKNYETYQSMNFNSSYCSSILQQSYSMAQICVNKIQELKQIFYQAIDQKKQIDHKNQQIIKQITIAKKKIHSLIKNKKHSSSPKPETIIRLTQTNQNQNKVSSLESKLNTKHNLINKDNNQDISIESIIRCDHDNRDIRKKGIRNYHQQFSLKQKRSQLQYRNLQYQTKSKEWGEQDKQRKLDSTNVYQSYQKIKIQRQEQIRGPQFVYSPGRFYISK